MGLDMYLSARLTTYRSFGKPDSEFRQTLVKAADELGLVGGADNIDTIEISREVGYWRKANQIHAWFVANVQEGEDNCRSYSVSREQLQELRDLCQRVLDGSELIDGSVTNGWTYENGVKKPIVESGKVIRNATLAQQLLPAQSGFFFGSTDYDEWYYEQLQATVEILDRCLALPEQFSFEYQSSW